MKTAIVLTTVLGCSLFLFGRTAVAQGSNSVPPIDTNSIPPLGSNSVQIVEKYLANFVLRPTTNAPAGAKGSANLKSRNINDSLSGKVSLQTRGLAPGDYRVTGVKASDGSIVPLGHFSVDDNHLNQSKPTKSKLSIPSDVDATDINEVTVETEGDIPMLTGSLADPSGKSFATLNAKASVIPGEAAPEAQGVATLKSHVQKGQRKDHFTLFATNVPSKSVFTVDVDGVDGGTVKSDGQGRVFVRKLPSGLDSISTVRLLDSTDAEVCRAEF